MNEIGAASWLNQAAAKLVLAVGRDLSRHIPNQISMRVYVLRKNPSERPAGDLSPAKVQSNQHVALGRTDIQASCKCLRKKEIVMLSGGRRGDRSRKLARRGGDLRLLFVSPPT